MSHPCVFQVTHGVTLLETMVSRIWIQCCQAFEYNGVKLVNLKACPAFCADVRQLMTIRTWCLRAVSRSCLTQSCKNVQRTTCLDRPDLRHRFPRMHSFAEPGIVLRSLKQYTSVHNRARLWWAACCVKKHLGGYMYSHNDSKKSCWLEGYRKTSAANWSTLILLTADHKCKHNAHRAEIEGCQW